MIAAIYARKSTDQSGVADDQKSVARQVETAKAYAASKGWAVDDAHVYVDDGISGAEFANRPGYVRLLASIKGSRAPFQVLVVSELSRLGREQLEVGYACKLFSQAGVAIHSYLEAREISLDSPVDKFLLGALNFAAEIEREKTRQRTTDAMARKARSGFVAGGDCFGYRNVEVVGADGARSHVVREVVPEHAEVVRRIFELSAAGYGMARVAKLLNAERAPAPRPRQGRPAGWAPSTVRSVLYRDAYRGVTTWNRSQKRDAWGQQRRRQRPRSEWIQVAAPALQIVSESLWQRAHERLAATRANYLRATGGKVWGRPVNGTAAKYLLTGLARCPQCGGNLEVRSRSHGKARAFFYGCSTYHRKGVSICANGREVPIRVADAAVLDALLGEILTPERLAEVARRAAAEVRRERRGDPGLRDRLKREHAAADKAVGRLTAAVAGGGGDVQPLVDALREQDAGRRAIEARLAALDAPPPSVGPEVIDRLRAAVGEWRTILGRQVPLARQIVQKLLVGKLTLGPEVRDGRAGWRFRATGTVEKLIAGSVPALVQAVVPSTGFEPVSPP